MQRCIKIAVILNQTVFAWKERGDKEERKRKKIVKEGFSFLKGWQSHLFGLQLMLWRYLKTKEKCQVCSCCRIERKREINHSQEVNQQAQIPVPFLCLSQLRAEQQSSGELFETFLKEKWRLFSLRHLCSTHSFKPAPHGYLDSLESLPAFSTPHLHTFHLLSYI